MPPRRWLTPSQFARAAGVTPAEITQSVKRGRIVIARRAGKKRIDLKTQLPRFMSTVKHAGHLKSTAADQAPKTGPKARGAGKNGKPKPPPPPTIDPIVLARQIQERYKTIDLARDHEIRAGNLVLREEVLAEFKDIAAKVKRGSLTIPDRLAPLVAEEKTRKRCFDILEGECRTILEDLADAIRNSKHSRSP